MSGVLGTGCQLVEAGLRNTFGASFSWWSRVLGRHSTGQGTLKGARSRVPSKQLSVATVEYVTPTIDVKRVLVVTQECGFSCIGGSELLCKSEMIKIKLRLYCCRISGGLQHQEGKKLSSFCSSQLRSG